MPYTYTVNQRIKYKVYFSTPFGSLGSTWLPGTVVAVDGNNVTIHLDNMDEEDTITTVNTDPNLKPA